MGAVTGTPAGTLRLQFRDQLTQPMEGVLAVASASGISLPPDAIALQLFTINQSRITIHVFSERKRKTAACRSRAICLRLATSP
jgi:hypothetical protein